MTDWAEDCKNAKTWEEIWDSIEEDYSNWEKALIEASQMTIDWLVIKHRLLENEHIENQTDLKIKIGTVYYEKSDKYIEFYPLYLNINEDYYHSFRIGKDIKYNSSRSIHDLIIYKLEWKDTLCFEWEYDVLKTFKYILFDDKDNWSEYVFMEECNFRG